VSSADVQVDLERVKYLVREATRLQPGRPALRMGLRAALAVTAPMVVASQLGALVTTWATLGGFGVVLVDKGGAYRTRATAMTAAAIGGAIAVLVGSVAGDSHAALAVIALGTATCAMAATWTGPAVAVGNTIAVQLIVSTTLPHDPTRPWLPALGFLAGGAWSVVLALVLWPVRVYRPARMAAMRCVREVARHAAEIAVREDADAVGWREAITRRHRAMRETLEAARAVLAATRRGRRGEIGRGERLLVIVESMDQLFGVLIGVEEVADNLSVQARAAIAGDLRAGLTAAAARLDEVADRVVVEQALPALPPIAWNAAELRSRAGALSPLARAEVDHAVSLITRIHEDVAAVTAVVESLADERELNYALYALFLTPTFVLLAEVHARDTHLVELRIANTLLGAGLAVAGALLLWPSREATRTADRLADAVVAAAGYVHEVFAAVATHAPARSAPVIAARRRAGRAFNNADLSLDRLVAERPPAAVLEPWMALATMTRRLAATLSAFGTARHVSDPSESIAVLSAIGGDAETYLRGAATALRTATPPPAYQRHDAAAGAMPALLAARVARIDLQLSIIAEAVARSVAVMGTEPHRAVRA
jgi:uncharacterized membrane protein YccC